MSKRKAQGYLAAALMLLNLPVIAEDIDLFAPRPPDEDTGRPQVLLIVDNTANWNTAFVNETAALVATFDGLPLDRFDIGIMFFGSPAVGYVRAAMRPMDAVNRPLYSAMINNLHVSNDRGDARTLARTFSEAHRYLRGLETVDAEATTGAPKNTKRDYTNNTAGNIHDDRVHARPGNALNSSVATRYNSPLDPDNCFGTYIIYIGNTVPSGNVVRDNAARNSAAGRELVNAGGDDTAIPLPIASVHDENYADEWTRFLREEMGVVTYTVDVDPTPMPGGNGNGMGNSALLESMATVSGGRYFRVNSAVGGGAEIAEALNRIFSEIQAKNSVFASVSLPLSVNTQGTYLNQIYIGMFRPDPEADPRWLGNLKQYRMGRDGADLVTQDADGQRAVNPLTGFITECARSYWTTDNPPNYWEFLDLDGDPDNDMPEMCIDANRFSNSPDGNLVEKGGQAQALRSDPRSDLWTCTGCGAGALLPFTTANVTAASLGVADEEHANTVNWGRGLDVDDEDADGVTVEETRPSAHGDVVHSRPVAINFGDVDADLKVVVFYGANDGILRGINGNREPTEDRPLADVAINGVAPGDELWAFMAPEFFPNIKRLRANDPAWRYLLTPFPDASEPKPYGVDGPITAYKGDEGAWLFAPLRRGGRAVYAFDVADIASEDPSPPTLKWKIGCPNAADDIGCTAGFEGLGQTWSSAKVVKSAGYPEDPADGPPAPLVIMGGGYDTCEDTDDGTVNHSCVAASNGRHVYVVDADTGVRLKTFDTERSVVADVFMVSYRCPDTDAAADDPDDPDDDRGACRDADGDIDGKLKWAYVADLGGNLYRISGETANTPIGTTPPGDWTMTKIASLGCDNADLDPDPAGNPCAANRKFIFAPDVVAKGSTYYLMVGSGDREKPLREFEATYGVDNYFFMVKDRPRDPLWLSGELAICGGSVLCLDSLLEIGVDETPDPDELGAKKGWYLELRDYEQIVTSAITVFGTTTFSSHTPYVPVEGTCSSDLGTARVYNIRYLDASSRNGTENRSEVIAGGGLPPSPVAGRVLLDGEENPVPFIIGASPSGPPDASFPRGAGTGRQPKSLTYWHIQK